MGDIIPINPSAGLPDEDPLEHLLDEESDEDFGYVVTRDRATGPDGHPVKLAEWTAQDFASIYTRFRPHLERHARRFLNNPSQVDEVVQDAFLYLMVSLPELDSEIGVLRFLKWKTRLLCLDVIRASGKAYVANLDDVAEPVSQDPEVTAYLEQQDDAAVLRLALSKLNPRHREVLLASIYEEKSATEISVQVGLSENATRQLIFRARSAFKKALLGDDVNTEGMSAAAILSVAARKAATEAKKVGAQAMVFALFLVLAVGALVNFTGRGNQVQQVAAPAPIPSPSLPITPAPVPSESVQIPIATPSAAPNSKPTNTNEAKPSATPSVSATPWNSADLNVIFNNTTAETEAFNVASVKKPIEIRQDYVVASENGVLAEFNFAAESANPFGSVKFTIEIAGQQYYAFPKTHEFYVVTDKAGLDHYIYFGSLAYIFDENGKVWSQSELAQSTARLELAVDSILGKIKSSSLVVLPKQ